MSSRGLCTKTLPRYQNRQLPFHCYHTFIGTKIYGSQISSQSATKQSHLQIPSGQDEADVTAKLIELAAPNNATRGKWALVLDGKGVQRSFKFKTFSKTWAFMQVVAEQCKVQKHHPEWSNCYNSTTILWTTHRPEGLTVKDVDMAAFCDEQARLHDEQIAVD